MAAPAGLQRDIGGEDGRAGLLGREDAVLAMAVRAHRGSGSPLGAGHPVDALLVGSGNLRVALAAGLRHPLMEDRGARVHGPEDGVAAVAVAAGGPAAPFGDGAGVDALPVGLQRLGHRDAELGHQLGVGVTPAAGLSQVGVMDRRGRIAVGDDRVNVAVAARAGGRFHAAVRAGAPVDAGLVLLHRLGVAHGAVHLPDALGVGELVGARVAVAAGEKTMGALGEAVVVELGVAGGAGGLVSGLRMQGEAGASQRYGEQPHECRCPHRHDCRGHVSPPANNCETSIRPSASRG